MQWKYLLEELGKAAGLGVLAPDDTGSCSLLFDGRHEVTLIWDEADSSVFLYGRVADGEAGRDEEAWRALLAASCLGAETGGAAFALYGKSLLLWKRHDAFVDYRDLEKALNSFLPQLILWQERLATPTSTSEAAPEGGGAKFPADAWPLLRV